MINKSDMVNVLNESTSPCYGISAINAFGYVFQPANDGEPSFEPVPFSDVQYINNKSDAFKTGTLRFEKELEDDIYNALHIRPESDRNYFTLADIEDIILNPTVETLEKIKEVTSVITIEKFRGVLTRLNNEDENDIAERVFTVINLRWDEISLGRMKSGIIIKKKKSKSIDKDVEVKSDVDEKSATKVTKTETKAK